jgi:hypothetical protein
MSNWTWRGIIHILEIPSISRSQNHISIPEAFNYAVFSDIFHYLVFIERKIFLHHPCSITYGSIKESS